MLTLQRRLLLLALLAGTGVVRAEANPAALRVGQPGFYSPMSGTIGSGNGSGFGQAGYVFIPGLGFQPAFTGGPVFPRFGHSGNPGPRAELDVKAPGLTDVWINGRFILGYGTERMVPTPVLPEGVDSYVRVRAAWRDGKQSRWVKVRPGEKVTVDFSQPDPEPSARKAPSPLPESHP